MSVTISGTNGISKVQDGIIESADFAAGVPSVSDLPAGSVLQVVNANQQTPTTTSSTSFVATPLQATITPTSTASKIVIIYSCQMYAATAQDFLLGVAKNGSVFANSTTKVNTGTSFNQTIAACVVDSPTSTSALTYAVYMRSLGASAITFNVDNYLTSIILMEIAA